MTPSDRHSVVVPAGTSISVGFRGVATAFKRAAVSQCHPSMLFALLLPFLIVFVGALLLLWFGWTPLTQWLAAQAAQWEIVNDVDAWLVAVGLFSIKLWLIPILACVILLPISGILGLAVAAVFVMPIVLRHIGPRNYPAVARMGRHATIVSTWNAIWVMAAFALGWGLTLPLWLVPPMAVLLSVFWWAFAFSRMLRIDAIVDHASPAEREVLLARHNKGFWMIGFVCAVINLLPPAWIVLPVYSALVFAHYGLNALEDLRRSQPPASDPLAGDPRHIGAPRAF